MRIAWYKSVILPANWKTALDAFIESWHVPGTHPQLLRPDKRSTPPTIAESRAVRRHLQRAVPATTPATPTSSATGPTGTRPSCGPPTASTPGPSTQRRVLPARAAAPSTCKTDLAAAEELRDHRGGRRPRGQRHLPAAPPHSTPGPPASTTPTVTDAQLKGAMYDWHVFPNTVFLIDMGCCLTYRARPNGNGPGQLHLRRAGPRAATAGGPADRRAPVLRRLAGRRTWGRSSPRTSPTCRR